MKAEDQKSCSPKIMFFRHSPVRSKGVCYGQSFQDTIYQPDIVADRFISAYQVWQKSYQDQPKHFRKKIWTSPAPRCLEPASIIADRMKCELNTDPQLYEMSFGQWEGKSWEEIESECPETFHAWMTHWKVISPPGGENLSIFHHRVGDWYDKLTMSSLNILIGHAGVWRSLLVHSRNLTWEEAMSISVPHLDIIVL